MTAPPLQTPGEEPIERGKRLVRLGNDGRSIGQQIIGQLHRLTWRTPLHNLRLNGRYPLKLLAVPNDPVTGDPTVGRALLDGAEPDESTPSARVAYQRSAWLRDLAAAGPRVQVAPCAERLLRGWLDRHGGRISDDAWAPELAGWRILLWTAHAPLILSSADIVYRSAVLNALARAARHLDRGAERATVGLPRITACIGLVAAGLLIPGGEPRRTFGEAALARALAAGVTSDGGIVSRNPAEQMELVELITLLARVYAVRGETLPPAVRTVLDRAVAALLGITLGDGALSSWQGTGPVDAATVAARVAASGIRTRPLRQARDWGYQRLSGAGTILVADVAPPPQPRIACGSASTLAFELSDAEHRLIVNCGGPGASMALPADLARGLRSTAAHSTLTLADTNSTAVLPDGSLGAGVGVVELDREEREGLSRIVASHDGYARRHGFIHRRTLALNATGRELHGEDALLPAPRGRRATGARFAIRFHLAPGIQVTPTADGLAALIRIEHGPLWQFRCRGGTLTIEDSLWLDAHGRPHATQQFVVEGEASAGGTNVTWLLKRAG